MFLATVGYTSCSSLLDSSTKHSNLRGDQGPGARTRLLQNRLHLQQELSKVLPRHEVDVGAEQFAKGSRGLVHVETATVCPDRLGPTFATGTFSEVAAPRAPKGCCMARTPRARDPGDQWPCVCTCAFRFTRLPEHRSTTGTRHTYTGTSHVT